MHFDLGSHIKSRSHSAQLEKTLASVAGMGSMSLTDGSKRSRPTLPAPHQAGPLTENANIANVGGSLRGIPGHGPRPSGHTVRFDVEPPKLLPAISMTYDELYAKPESVGEGEAEAEIEGKYEITNEPEVDKENDDPEDQDEEKEGAENEIEGETQKPLGLTC